MKVDKELVEKIAQLAKLEFDEASKSEIINDLNKILAFVEKLNKLDTTNVEPLVYVNEESKALRKDQVKQTISREQALKNAPLKDDQYFKVPKVIKRP